MGRLAARANAAEDDLEDDTLGEVEEDDSSYDEDDWDDFDDFEEPSAPRWLGVILLIGGILGFGASFMLTFEELEMLKDPNYLPTCSIDAVLQCGSVMMSDQASLFGFPNPWIGLIAFPVIIVSGTLVLARVSLPAWYYRWLLVGCTLGLVFVGWLISQTLYEIRALCPYCMVVWAVVIPMFWRTLGWTLAGGASGAGVAESRAATILDRYWWVFTLVTYAVVLTLVLTAFPYYFF